MAEYELNYRPIPDKPLYTAATKFHTSLLKQDGDPFVHVLRAEIREKPSTPPASYQRILLGEIASSLESKQSGIWEEDEVIAKEISTKLHYRNLRISNSFQYGMRVAFGTLDMLHGDIATPISVLESIKSGVRLDPVDLGDPDYIRETPLLDFGHDGLHRIGDTSWNQVELWANCIVSDQMPRYEHYRRICMLGSGAVFEAAYQIHSLHNEWAALLDLSTAEDSSEENTATTGE